MMGKARNFTLSFLYRSKLVVIDQNLVKFDQKNRALKSDFDISKYQKDLNWSSRKKLLKLNY
jgi:hypothetical protein